LDFFQQASNSGRFSSGATRGGGGPEFELPAEFMGRETEPAGDDRPREKLTRNGVASLGDVELLALVLGHGTAGRSALRLAAEMLGDVDGVHGLTRVSPARLALIPGVGAAKSTRVLAAIELGRRTLLVSPRARLQFASPDECGSFLVPRYGAHPTERFGAVLLDSRHRMIRIQIVSEGALDAALAIPRDVFREAAICRAAAVVVFHNHPSGDPRPTSSDLELTRRLVDAGTIVGIDVLDHVILADTVFYSMRKANRI
jgi:DNA repair protein RadC